MPKPLIPSKILLAVSKDFDQIDDCYDLAIDLLEEGKGYVTSRPHVTHTTSIAFDIMREWQMQQGDNATGKALIDTLLGLKKVITAEHFAEQVGLKGYVEEKTRHLRAPKVVNELSCTTLAVKETTGDFGERQAQKDLVDQREHWSTSDTSVGGSAAVQPAPTNQLNREQIYKLSKSNASLQWEDIAELLPDFSRASSGATGDAKSYSFSRAEIAHVRQRFDRAPDKCLKEILHQWQDRSLLHSINDLRKVCRQVDCEGCFDSALEA